MSLDVALYEYVRTYAALLDTVNGRVFPSLAPQQAIMPFLVYTEIGYYSERQMLGASALKWATYQWDVYATRHQQAREIGAALTTAFDGIRGLYSGVSIRQGYVRARRTTMEDNAAGDQQMYFRVSLDIEFCYYT